MKRLIELIKNYIKGWRAYFRMRKIDRISERLYSSMLEKAKGRNALKKEILDYIRVEFKVNPKKSEYIKPSLRREIVDAIYKKYRTEMREFEVIVNYSLQFAK